MTLPGFFAALQTGDPIIVRGAGDEPLHVPVHALRHGRSDIRLSRPAKSRNQLRGLISFRKEGKKK